MLHKKNSWCVSKMWSLVQVPVCVQGRGCPTPKLHKQVRKYVESMGHRMHWMPCWKGTAYVTYGVIISMYGCGGGLMSLEWLLLIVGQSGMVIIWSQDWLPGWHKLWITMAHMMAHTQPCDYNWWQITTLLRLLKLLNLWTETSALSRW